MWERAGLIGDTGFVGGVLARQVAFAKAYNSRTIDLIQGERFGALVCAGAPAAMWAANANPEGDRANLQRLASHIESASAGRLILISSIAVLDDVAAGYTEADARYETLEAYGRNRRELELRVMEHPEAIVIRLPALFGPGLKKNFIFDIMNPIPSFLKTDRYQQIYASLGVDERVTMDRFFSFDAELQMHKLDRAGLDDSGKRQELEAAFDRGGFAATAFTNSESEYQYYNLERLKNDIETCVEQGIKVLHICSEPLRAGDLHEALTGKAFRNAGPPVWKEDMRTMHGRAFGRNGPHLYGRGEVIEELRNFVSSA